MANAFARAATKTVAAPKPKKSQTLWQVDEQLAEDITQFVEIQGRRKALETMETVLKGSLKEFAEECYVKAFAAAGVEPDKPMQLVNRSGQTVTYVVQDKTAGYAVKEDMVDALEQVLGPDGAAEVLCEQTTYGFSPAVMMQETADGSSLVQDVLGERLLVLLDEMKLEGVLNQDQVDELLTAKTIRTFRPGTLDLAAEICGRNVSRLSAFLAALGSAVVRYVRP